MINELSLTPGEARARIGTRSARSSTRGVRPVRVRGNGVECFILAAV